MSKLLRALDILTEIAASEHPAISPTSFIVKPLK